jgi:hypothetical protein
LIGFSIMAFDPPPRIPLIGDGEIYPLGTSITQHIIEWAQVGKIGSRIFTKGDATVHIYLFKEGFYGFVFSQPDSGQLIEKPKELTGNAANARTMKDLISYMKQLGWSQLPRVGQIAKSMSGSLTMFIMAPVPVQSEAELMKMLGYQEVIQ